MPYLFKKQVIYLVFFQFFYLEENEKNLHGRCFETSPLEGSTSLFK